jgi:hypothetical protein
MHCTVDVTVPFLVKERKFSENKSENKNAWLT